MIGTIIVGNYLFFVTNLSDHYRDKFQKYYLGEISSIKLEEADFKDNAKIQFIANKVNVFY